MINYYLKRLLQPIKPFLHSVTTDDDLALDINQNENWQYFLETILVACNTNNCDINNTIEKYQLNKKYYREHHNL